MNREFMEFALGGSNGLFDIKTPNRKFNANTLTFGGKYPYVIRSSLNNGIKGYITQDARYLNDGNTISFGQDTATMFYQKNPYFTGDKIKILSLKERGLNEKSLCEVMVSLPVTSKGSIDYEYMENFISELERERVRELEKERTRELEAYLKVTDFNDYALTHEEQEAIDKLDEAKWETYDVESLFGKSTRGRRLKSIDRVSGQIPFVTAGEKNEGISAYIGNDVEIFSKNTSTIDMFGSAKYRNYDYGADDHYNGPRKLNKK